MENPRDATERITASTEKLIAWLETQQYRGVDPYDALNSPLLGALARRNHYFGILFTQIVRRSPFNLRPMFGIRPGYNPKGMGLLLTSFVRRYRVTGNAKDLEQARFFAEWLAENSSKDYHGACWGYNFDWANRSFLAPLGTPTIVNTAFIAQALEDFALVTGETWAFEMARSACDFILRDLNRHETGKGICFSYTSRDTRFVHNANMLGAALLARIGKRTGKAELIETAKRAATFTVAEQAADGSWKYGLATNDGWMDNFHTGFVLGALADILDLLAWSEWDGALTRGYGFWRRNFLLSDGTPKYTPQSVYPIDAHSVAETVLLALRMQSRDPDAFPLATRTLEWGILHLQDPRGYFHYQVTRFYTNRIPYLRWSNAWMLWALTEWLRVVQVKISHDPSRRVEPHE